MALRNSEGMSGSCSLSPSLVNPWFLAGCLKTRT